MFVVKNCFVGDLDAEFLKALNAHVLKLPEHALTLKDGDGCAWLVVVGRSPGTCMIWGFIGVEAKLEPARQERDLSMVEVVAS